MSNSVQHPSLLTFVITSAIICELFIFISLLFKKNNGSTQINFVCYKNVKIESIMRTSTSMSLIFCMIAGLFDIAHCQYVYKHNHTHIMFSDSFPIDIFIMFADLGSIIAESFVWITWYFRVYISFTASGTEMKTSLVLLFWSLLIIGDVIAFGYAILFVIKPNNQHPPKQYYLSKFQQPNMLIIGIIDFTMLIFLFTLFISKLYNLSKTNPKQKKRKLDVPLIQTQEERTLTLTPAPDINILNVQTSYTSIDEEIEPNHQTNSLNSLKEQLRIDENESKHQTNSLKLDANGIDTTYKIKTYERTQILLGVISIVSQFSLLCTVSVLYKLQNYTLSNETSFIIYYVRNIANLINMICLYLSSQAKQQPLHNMNSSRFHLSENESFDEKRLLVIDSESIQKQIETKNWFLEFKQTNTIWKSCNCISETKAKFLLNLTHLWWVQASVIIITVCFMIGEQIVNEVMIPTIFITKTGFIFSLLSSVLALLIIIIFGGAMNVNIFRDILWSFNFWFKWCSSVKVNIFVTLYHYNLLKTHGSELNISTTWWIIAYSMTVITNALGIALIAMYDAFHVSTNFKMALSMLMSSFFFIIGIYWRFWQHEKENISISIFGITSWDLQKLSLIIAYAALNAGLFFAKQLYNTFFYPQKSGLISTNLNIKWKFK
eukprot:187837_1